VRSTTRSQPRRPKALRLVCDTAAPHANPNGIASLSPRLAEHRDAYLGSRATRLPSSAGFRPVGLPRRGTGVHRIMGHRILPAHGSVEHDSVPTSPLGRGRCSRTLPA